MADGAHTVEAKNHQIAGADGVGGGGCFTHVVDGFEWPDDPDPAIDEAIADEAMRTGDLIPAEDVVAWMRSWFTPDELPMPLPLSQR